MKWTFGKSSKLLYFQVRESPVPLRILTPTPAPDHLLGGHNELNGTSFDNSQNGLPKSGNQYKSKPGLQSVLSCAPQPPRIVPQSPRAPKLRHRTKNANIQMQLQESSILEH